MKVRELIRLLENYPQDLDVVVDGYEYGVLDLAPEWIGVAWMRPFDWGEDPVMGGPHQLIEVAKGDDSSEGEHPRRMVLSIARCAHAQFIKEP